MFYELVRLRLCRLTCTLGFGFVCLITTHAAAAQTSDGFFTDDVLQEVRVVMSARDWQTLQERADENTYYTADITWKGVKVRNAGLRSRGSGTRNGLKPGLRVDVNHYVSSQTFLGLKSFILDNAYSDPSTIRESLTMKLFARMGIAAPREAHARVYVNNQYVGVYVVVESVDREFIARAFGTQEANVEKGGYLFEYRWVTEYHLEYPGPELERFAPMFKPQTRDTDSIVALYRPIEEMIRTINQSADEDFEAATGVYLDLRSFMRHLAVETFVADSDGLAGNWGVNNFYLYRFRDAQRSQLIPWDKDQSFLFTGNDIMLRLDENVLTRRALASPGLREAYLEALSEVARIAQEPGENDPRGWLEREIDREFGQVATAITEDGRFPFTTDEINADVAHLHEFASGRVEFVQCEVSNLANPDGEQQACSASAPRTPEGSR